MKKIYLACPYTDSDPDKMEERFKSVNIMAGYLMQQGYLVFSPISHTHPIAVSCKLPRGFDFWEAYDRTFIDWCDEVWVHRISGWENSKGVTREIDYATKQNKPIKYL